MNGIGATDIVFGLITFGMSVYALVTMVQYEKAMMYVGHHILSGGSTSVQTVNQHFKQPVSTTNVPVPAPTMPTQYASTPAQPSSAVFNFA
jgi:hypothetical protein